MQYNDRRDDRVGRPHHQEHGRTHLGRGREDVRRQKAVNLGRRPNGFQGLSLNYWTILFLVILMSVG